MTSVEMGLEKIRCGRYWLDELSLNNKGGKAQLGRVSLQTPHPLCTCTRRGKRRIEQDKPHTAVLRKSWPSQWLPIKGIPTWRRAWAGTRTPTALSHQPSATWGECGLSTQVGDTNGGMWCYSPTPPQALLETWAAPVHDHCTRGRRQ